MDAIRYELATRPGKGETMRIADGVTWLRMPLPFSLDHINLWLLRDDGGWVIVDTGIDTKTTRKLWREVFDNDMRGDPATHVIATHLHPDHVGCAGWLAREFDVDLWLTREEYLLCRLLIGDTGKPAPEEGVAFYRAAGFDDEQIATYRENFGLFGRFVGALPNAHRRMKDGDVQSFAGHEWEVVIGRGHSPEHACLLDAERNVLISGDQILPTISPNVSVWPTEPLANPLQDFFDSIDTLEARLPEDVLVLPAHGKPFRGAHVRLEQLRREHAGKLESLLENGKEPRRVVDVFPDLFGAAINDGNRIMATGEALAHLHYLCDTGDMTAQRDDDGVTWFRRA
ncbi:MAG: MBL fold metallo-hydrolase [Proteobacteria bacterium]|nr:MBL fold metallo-hydrolase [Pseudomonadota bacterium]